MLSSSIITGTLPRTTRSSIISLLYKNGDHCLLKSWRPISLMTTDYKIISKCLSTRVSRVMTSLIHEDQSYCVPGRSIYDSLHFFRDFIRYANADNKNVAIVSLDQESAFDNVTHEYLFYLLGQCNFGTNIVNLIKLLYTNGACMVRTSHLLTSPINVRKGIRQGCPLSGVLFSLCLEPLLGLLRSRMAGLRLPNPDSNSIFSKVVAYADDVNVIATERSDFEHILDCFKIYAVNSGAILNRDKCKGYWLGGLKGSTATPMGIPWTSGEVKILGVIFKNGKDVVDDRILDSIFKKLQSAAEKWKHMLPSLSWRGRVIAINQFLAPKLWYSLQVLPIPQAFLKKIQKYIIDLFWVGKKHWMTEQHICLPVSHGGLGLVQLQCKQQLFRFLFSIKFLTCTEHPKWLVMTKHFLSTFRNSGLTWQILFMKPHLHVDQHFPQFYFEVLESLEVLHLKIQELPTTSHNVDDLPLANSRLIPLSQVSISSLWFSCGLYTFSQLRDSNHWKDFEDLNVSFYSRVLKNNLRINFELLKQALTPTFDKSNCQDSLPSTHWQIQDHNGKTNNISSYTRRDIQRIVTLKYYQVKEPLKGAWSDDGVYWKNFIELPTMSHEHTVSFRFAKNRLADLVFLKKSGKVQSDICPTCNVVGTAWHLIIQCENTRELWNFIRALLIKFLNRPLYTVDIYSGLSQSLGEQSKLCNFLLNLAKSTIYNILTDNNLRMRTLQPYLPVYKSRLKARISKEFIYFSGKDNLEGFSKNWAHKGILCNISNGVLTFNI